MNLALKFSIQASPKFHCQADLAQHTGIREDEFSRIVRGRKKPTAEQAKRIAQALGVEVGEIFTELRGEAVEND